MRADDVFDAAVAIAREVVDERSEGKRLSEIQQRAMREHVPTRDGYTFGDIIDGQRKAMDRAASEFVAPYLQRITKLTRDYMAAQSALDNEKQAHRKTAIELDLARNRIAKLESENKALRKAIDCQRCSGTGLVETGDPHVIGAQSCECRKALRGAT